MRDETTTTMRIRRFPAQPNNRAPSRWLPWLTLILLFGVAVLLHLVPRDPILLARFAQLTAPFQRAQRARILANHMRRDPPLGSKPLSGKSPLLVAALRHQGRRPVILLFTGPCTSCSGQYLEEWHKAAREFPNLQWLAVSRDTQDNIDKFVKLNGARFQIVADPSGTIAQSFNAFYAPRAYAIDSIGALTWIQTAPEMTPNAIMKLLCGSQEG